ncbi:MAG: AraC family transcriptional regulator [Candidatus Hydrogenedentota bacterium]
MLYDEFLESEFAQRILNRAAAVANTSFSIFKTESRSETEHLETCGDCAQACAYVNKLPWGPQACRNSRSKAIASAQRRNKPVPFLCHMGFSCVAMSVYPETDAELTMVFGPFCPSEAPGSLEGDAKRGLAKLITEDEIDVLPFELDDIPLSSAATVPDVAQWLGETLADSIKLHESPAPLKPTLTKSGSKSARPSPPAAQSPYHAGAIVAALVGGRSKEARLLLKSQITDTASRRRTRIAVKRARCIAVVAAVLEWAERSETNKESCWTKFDSLNKTIATLENDSDLLNASMKVLAPIAKKSRAPKTTTTKNNYDFKPINDLILSRIKQGITLNEVATTLGENPTTITKRLQRNFGLSYSDYLGRMKINQAKTLLRQPKLTITEVARRVGLNDSANFSKLFRKHEGITPSAFRKQFASPRAK